MESLAIKNTQELQSEIQRLKVAEAAQKIALGQRFSSPSAIFGSVRSLFPQQEGAKGSGLLHPDIINLISRFAIPFTLNKTVFKHSNFLVKALVGFVSQKAAGFVTESAAEDLLSKGKNLFNQLSHKAKETKKIIKADE